LDPFLFLIYLVAAVIIRTIIYYGLMQIFDSMFGCFIIMIDFIVSLLLIGGTELTDDPIFMIPLISLLAMFGVFACIIIIKDRIEQR